VTRRWTVRPEGSTWGDFGVDDQRGQLNLITDERRLAAVREVRVGRAFALSLPLDTPMGGLHPSFRRPPLLSETAGHSTPFADLYGIAGAIDIGCDDSVTLNTQYSTQWDALSHVGALFDISGEGKPEPVYYNGFRADTDIVGQRDGQAAAALRLGVEQLAQTGLQGRGVLVDLYAAFGRAKVAVDLETLSGVMDEAGVTVERGDIVCFHTGFSAAVLAAADDTQRSKLRGSFAEIDGHDPGLLEWIADTGIAAIAADNIGVEGLAPQRVHPGGPVLPLHHHCLFKLGVPIGELWYLNELAQWLGAAQRSRFLLTAPPLRLTGAVASPATPVATV
jgi:kynurenine formamidase